MTIILVILILLSLIANTFTLIDLWKMHKNGISVWHQVFVLSFWSGLLSFFPSFMIVEIMQALGSVGGAVWVEQDYLIFALVFILLFSMFFMLVEFARRLFSGRN